MPRYNPSKIVYNYDPQIMKSEQIKPADKLNMNYVREGGRKPWLASPLPADEGTRRSVCKEREARDSGESNMDEP
jgi:hypothetical protein